MFNRNVNNGGFSEAVINAVWNKGKIVAGYNPSQFRKDSCGAWMQRSAYGNTNTENGWEVDHIRPVARDGSDFLDNLQPLQWENNRHKSDSFPNWTCKIKAA